MSPVAVPDSAGMRNRVSSKALEKSEDVELSEAKGNADQSLTPMTSSGDGDDVMASSAMTASPPASLSEGSDISTSRCPSESVKRVLESITSVNRKVRASRMDIDPSSSINVSEHWGFATLTCVATTFSILSQPLNHYFDSGEFFDPSLGRALMRNITILIAVSLVIFTFNFTAYFAFQLYRQRAISRPLLRSIQHTCQAIVICGSAASCIFAGWSVLTTSFIVLQACCTFMKMHSYTETMIAFEKVKNTSMAVPEYPQCCTLSNFAHYALCPVLVYEPNYPRGPGFRPVYFVKKLLAMGASFALLYLILTKQIIPIVFQSARLSIFETFFRLMIPVLAVDFLAFYILFESICNLFGEITNFGDREFYTDWWNCTGWDEYARKWNRPVHEFLLRHVYKASIDRLKLGPIYASVVTFFFSALFHELVIATCVRNVRMWIIMLMMFQIPLILLSKWHKGKFVGNLIFWIGIMTGIPIMLTLYCREWAAAETGTLSTFRMWHIL